MLSAAFRIARDWMHATERCYVGGVASGEFGFLHLLDRFVRGTLAVARAMESIKVAWKSRIRDMAFRAEGSDQSGLAS